MKKLLVLFGLMFVIFACSNDCLNVANECLNGRYSEKNNNENNQGNSNTEDPGKRPTTLQDVVDNANAGEEIDLSNYELTSYTATVNKKLTIKNGSLNNAKLQITAENVKLEKLTDLSVTSSSRLTINDSKLSSLLIGGNGETSRSRTSEAQTSLAMVTVTDSEIENVELNGFNSQLNITDTLTKIADILTSTKSKIILEAGSYDGMKDPVVEDNGELTRIDMTKDKELSVLSIYSNPKKAEYKLNEEIDLTGLIVMGTYTASVEIFKSGGWKGEARESVTKWEDEKDYSVDYDFSTAGIKIVTIKSKSADVECNFYVYVVDDSQNDETSKPEKEEIKFENIRVVTLGTVKTLYKVGEKLDLSCYQVVGTYNDFDINLPYTSEPANGMVLTAENKEIKFYYNGESVGTKEITVRRPCTVEFYDGIGSSELVCKTEVAFGESLKLPIVDERADYTFDGWYNGETKIEAGSSITEGLTLTAKWKANTYTITYYLAYGKNADNNPQNYTVETQTLPLADATRTGYTFVGWYTDEACTDTNRITQIAAGSSGNITLFAKWNANTYTVKFDSNGGSGTMTAQTFTYDTEQALTANTFTRTGYTFAGWNTQPDGKGTSYTDKERVKNLTTQADGEVILYAVWTPNTYTVKFNANGGSSAMDSQTFTYDKEQALTANTFTRTGYTFAGWNTEANGSGTSYTDKKNVKNLTAENNATITLYAQWTPNKSGITITLPSINDAEINLESETNGNIVTFTANGGFKSYAWYIDGVKQSETSATFAIDTSTMNPANYKIMVIVSDDNKYYSATADLEIRN